MQTTTYQPTPAELTEARAWIADCEWADDTTDLTDAEVVRGIAYHYDGGWAGFISDASPASVNRLRVQRSLPCEAKGHGQ